MLRVATENKMVTQGKFKDERIKINQRIDDLEAQLSETIQKHIDYMYSRERAHNMECQ